jgi:hypothetical protein
MSALKYETLKIVVDPIRPRQSRDSLAHLSACS